MKKVISMFLFTLFSFPLLASSIVSRVYELEILPNDPEVMVKFESGEVAFVPVSNSYLISEIIKAKSQKALLNFSIDERRTLQSFNKVNILLRPEKTPEFIDGKIEFMPTVLNSISDASNIFKNMRRDWQYYSQCYNRAHVWAYEAQQEYNLSSMKLFMFFTSRYIREYRYQWWFHVAPMTYIKEEERGRPVVLDRRFASIPLSPKAWSDLFIYSKRSCSVVYRYSDYENNQQTEDCYHIPVSMYFWQPRDIAALEQEGIEKDSFFREELRWAYREAF